MNLQRQIDTIDFMVNENPDATISDFMAIKNMTEEKEREEILANLEAQKGIYLAGLREVRKSLDPDYRRVELIHGTMEVLESTLYLGHRDLERVKTNWQIKYGRIYNESKVVVI